MGDILQFGRPEEVGVRPEWVEEYVQEMNRRRKMCHSVLMMRHGKVFAEGYWKPFGPQQLHRMYSVSKSFVSAAVGLLADQGRISLDDRIVTYFPDLLPEQVNPYLERTTIRDMLRMATPYPNGATYRGSDQNWIETFFQAPHGQADHPAGTRFLYDTSCSYTLNVLVERLTGMPFLEYLKDNMLRELGFSEEAWCVQAPEGYSWGGSGVECTTRDLARFALVFLNGGALGGKRYLSREYVRQATSKQIDNLGPEGVDKMHGNGYGYQIWMTCDGSFSFCGMGGQLAICVPQKDFLLVCTSDMQGDPDEYTCVFDVLWDTVLNRLDSETAPLDDRALCPHEPDPFFPFLQPARGQPPLPPGAGAGRGPATAWRKTPWASAAFPSALERRRGRCGTTPAVGKRSFPLVWDVTSTALFLKSTIPAGPSTAPKAPGTGP